MRNKFCRFRHLRKCTLRTFRRGIFPILLILLAITSGVIILILAGVQDYKPVEILCSSSSTSNFDAFLLGKVCKHDFNDSALNKERQLDLEGEDVLIFLHIQKTGGAMFGRHLVRNLDVDFPCNCLPSIKKCVCLTKNKKLWLFSRHATGWICGLHADWTELMDCVDEWFKRHDAKSRKHRIYHYITFLRNPVNRFLSEWLHVQRGATWNSARLHCNGKDASLEEVPFCFSGQDWSGVTLDDFLYCKHNLAFNRMTRMLANLSRVNCYNHTSLGEKLTGEIILRSAKENLLDCAFFGLVEEQRKVQFLFENTFGIEFIENFQQRDETHTSSVNISEELMKNVLNKNRLDIELYQFAKDLFLQRVSYMEKRLGYTVEEYFRRKQDADSSSLGRNEITNSDEYDDDNERDEDIEEIINSYPSKSARLRLFIKNSDFFRKHHR